MKARLLSISPVICFALFCGPEGRAQAVVGDPLFVDADTAAAPAEQDGTSWGTAYRYLQDGLNRAVAGQELWIADGVYYPDVDAAGDSGSRQRSFAMVPGVSMYGGFAGGEGLREERRPDRNLTILSGDIGQDDLQQPIATHVEPQSGDEDNSFRVVDMSACANGDTLDGFVITAGRADASPDYLDGAGVFCSENARIKNCWITGNYAAQGGGGLYIDGTKSFIAGCRVNGNVAIGTGGGVYARSGKIRFFNCAFRGNMASDGGGLFVGTVADFKLINCAVSGNSALVGGGGIEVDGGKLVAANCTVAGNYSAGAGGGLKLSSAKGKAPTLRNVILWANHGGGSTTSSVASIYFSGKKATPKVTNSLVANSGGSAAWNGSGGSDGGENLDLDPHFLDPITPSARPTEQGFLNLLVHSPAIDAGLEAYLLADSADLDADADTQEFVPFDLDGRTRVVFAEVDLGAYEYSPQLLPPVIVGPQDSDGDGLSDEFERRHTGDPVLMEAMSDQDVDSSTALGEYLHGTDPTSGTTVPAVRLGTVNYLGTDYLTLTFNLDPAALQFVTYHVERCGDVGTLEIWHDDGTVEIASGPSLDFPGLLEVTHRSLAPLGQERREFLRLRHIVINPASS